MHGFALNVCPDLSGFDRIVPCGICDRSVGSMAQFIPDINPDLVREQIIQVFGEVFGIEMLEGEEV
jgi:lipoyl(octanoyl) transferase